MTWNQSGDDEPISCTSWYNNFWERSGKFGQNVYILPSSSVALSLSFSLSLPLSHSLVLQKYQIPGPELTRETHVSDNLSQIAKSVNLSRFEKAATRLNCKKLQFVPNCLIDRLITLVFGNHKFCKILPKFLPMVHFLQESHKFVQKSQFLQIC